MKQKIFMWFATYIIKLRKQPILHSELLKISDVLTTEQSFSAFSFYNKHKERLDKLSSETDKAYEPSESEDKNNPMLWKAEYWKWFLINCHNQ